MNALVILIIVLILFGGLGNPYWYGSPSYGWGMYGGGLGLILLILLILFLLEKL